MAAAGKTLYDAIEATAREFIASTDEAVATKDSSKIRRTLAPESLRLVRPGSLMRALGFPEDLALPVDAYLAEIENRLPHLTLAKPTVVHSVLVDERRRAAVVYVTSSVREGREQEFVFMLYMDEAGDKIVKVVQFVDSAEIVALRKEEQA